MTKASKKELQTTDVTKSMNEAIDNFVVRMTEEDKLLYEQFVSRLAGGTTCSRFVEFLEEYKVILFITIKVMLNGLIVVMGI